VLAVYEEAMEVLKQKYVEPVEVLGLE